MKVVVFQGTERIYSRLYWQLPGDTVWQIVPSDFMVPFEAPSVIVWPSVVSFRSQSGTEVRPRQPFIIVKRFIHAAPTEAASVTIITVVCTFNRFVSD
jgi:hypothetical protein